MDNANVPPTGGHGITNLGVHQLSNDLQWHTLDLHKLVFGKWLVKFCTTWFLQSWCWCMSVISQVWHRDAHTHTHQSIGTSHSVFKYGELQPTHHHLSWICNFCMWISPYAPNRWAWNYQPRCPSVVQWHAVAHYGSLQTFIWEVVTQLLHNFVSAILVLVHVCNFTGLAQRCTHIET